MPQLLENIGSNGCVSQTELAEKPGSQIQVLSTPPYPTGRLVIRFLQQKAEGATLTEILDYLRTQHHKDSRDMTNAVESILENGTAMGFLERKGSCFINWLARDHCCSRSRRRCGRRRRCSRRRRRRCRRRCCRCRRPGPRRRPRRC